MKVSILWKFENPEIFIFEKYFKVSTFEIKKSSEEIIYHFETDNDFSREYFLWVKPPSIEDRITGTSDVRVFFGVTNNVEDGYETKNSFDDMQSEFAPLNFFMDLADDTFRRKRRDLKVRETHDNLGLQNEASIFEKYYKLTSFHIEREEGFISYIYKREGDMGEYDVVVRFPTQEEINSRDSERLVSVGYMNVDGKYGHDYISLGLLRDLAIFFNEQSR